MVSRGLLIPALLLSACDDGGREFPDTGFFARDTGEAPAEEDAGGANRDAAMGAHTIQVQSVFDGDTIRVVASVSVFTPDNKPMAGETIRFLGINAPEIEHPPTPAECWGPESLARARTLLAGQQITVAFDIEPSCPTPVPASRAESCGVRDQFGRLLGYITLVSDGRVVNEVMLSEGNARSFRAFPHRDTAKYNSLEAAAQRANLGMWSRANCP